MTRSTFAELGDYLRDRCEKDKECQGYRNVVQAVRSLNFVYSVRVPNSAHLPRQDSAEICKMDECVSIHR